MNREALEVTERGQPIAVLQPIADPEDRFVRLEARAISLRRGLGNLAQLPPPVTMQLPRPLGEVLQDLREDRV
jgi:antitoxin (DNA-binding transcriptional repressor) of toxin-antitoxin stability system